MTKMRVETIKRYMLAALLAFMPIKASAAWPVNYLAGGQGQPSDFYSIPDGSGGVYNVWSSTGPGNETWTRVYVQHLTAAGAADWMYNVGASDKYQDLYLDPMPGYNGAPGLTVAWLEHFDGTEYSPAKMMVQRFNTSGSLGWGGGAGIVVSSGTGIVDGGLMTIASDGNPVFGLAYVNGSGAVNLAFQKTDGANCLWPASMPCSAASGTLLLTSANGQDLGTLALVPASTQVVVAVSTGIMTANSSVSGYRISDAGTLVGQFPIANGSGGRGSDIAGLPDGSDGSYFVWIDSRTGTGNLFASRVNVSGVPSGMDQVQLTSLASPVSGISNMVPAAGGFAVIYTTGSEQTQRAYLGRVAANAVLSTGVTAGLDAMSRGLMCRENDCYVSGFSGQTGGHDLVRVPYTGATTRRQLFAGGYGYYSMDIASSSAGGIVSWANAQGHSADKFLASSMTVRQITGTISYSGTYAPDITLTVRVSTSMDFHGAPYYTQIINPSASQPYTITGVPADTYYMAATASYDWTVPHSTDAWGVLGQLGTPTAIDLAGGDASGKDVSLTDGNTQPNPFSPASQTPAVVYCSQTFANGGSCKIDDTSTYSTALAVDASSNVYVIGTNLTNSAIVKYDKDGVLLSSVTFKNSVFNDIKVNPVNGDLYIAAQGPASGIHLFRYAPALTLVSSITIAGYQGARQLDFDSYGDVYAVSTFDSGGADGYDMRLVKLPASLSGISIDHVYNSSPGPDQGYGIHIDTSDVIFISGLKNGAPVVMRIMLSLNPMGTGTAFAAPVLFPEGQGFNNFRVTSGGNSVYLAYSGNVQGSTRTVINRFDKLNVNTFISSAVMAGADNFGDIKSFGPEFYIAAQSDFNQARVTRYDLDTFTSLSSTQANVPGAYGMAPGGLAFDPSGQVFLAGMYPLGGGAVSMGVTKVPPVAGAVPAEAEKPYITATVPAAGSVNVSSGIRQIDITFSEAVTPDPLTAGGDGLSPYLKFRKAPGDYHNPRFTAFALLSGTTYRITMADVDLSSYTVYTVEVAGFQNGESAIMDAASFSFTTSSGTEESGPVFVSSTLVTAASALGQPPSIVLLPAGPLVTYKNSDQSSLKVMRWNGAAWAAEFAANVPSGSGIWQQLAVDNSGKPWVAYNDQGYISVSSNTAGTVWNSVVAASVAEQELGWNGVAMAFGPDGSRHIVFRNNTSGDLLYTEWDGAFWTEPAKIDDTGDDSMNPSIAVSASGEPYVVYYASSTQELKYVRNNGVWNTPEVLDTEYAAGQYSSIGLESDGDAVVAYQVRNADTYTLKFRKQTSGVWDSPLTLDSYTQSGTVPMYVSVAVDTATDRARIAYRFIDTSIQYGDGVKFASATASGWLYSTVDKFTGGGVVYGLSPLKLDSAGAAHVAFAKDAHYIGYARSGPLPYAGKPFVTASTPGNLASGVSNELSLISVTFSEPVTLDSGDIGTKVRLYAGETDETASRLDSFTLDTGSTYVLQLKGGPLSPGTAYRVELSGFANASEAVMDPSSFTFTTSGTAPATVRIAAQSAAGAFMRYYNQNPALKLSLWTDSGSSSWSGLGANIAGTVNANSEVDNVYLYRDNGDGAFSISSDTYVAGTSVWYSSVWLNLNTPEEIGVSTKTYFLTVSPKSWAIGKTVRMAVTSTSSFSLGAYDTVLAPGLPVLSNPATVMSYIFANETGSSNPDTDISVMTGQALQIFSTGTWSYNGGSTFVTGAGSGACSVSCPLPAAQRGALIARGYNIPWFVVGLSTIIVPSGSDTLYLAMNDDNYNDNIGMMMFNKAAIASTKTWTGAACGGISCNEASNPANWQDGVLPAYGDNVVFGAAGVKDCFWNMNITLNSLSLEQGYTGRVSMLNAPGMSVNRLEISDFMRIRGGTMNLTGHVVAASSISVSGGTLDLGGGYGALEVGEGGLHVFGSGTLAFTGSSNVTLSPLDASPYPVEITGGTVTVNGTGRLNINGSAGVTVSTAAGVPALTFNRVGVYSTPAGAAALTVNAGAGVFTFNDWLFDATVSKNVDGSLLGGSALVRMNNAGGDRMGTPHEFADPGNRVVWNPDGGGTGGISGLITYSGSEPGDYLVFVTTDMFSNGFIAKSSFPTGSYAFAGLKAPATYYLWAVKDSDYDLDYSPQVMEPVAWSTSPVILSTGGAPALDMTMLDTGKLYGGIDKTATSQVGRTIVSLYAGGEVDPASLFSIDMLDQWDYEYSLIAPSATYTVMAYVDANQNGRLDPAFESSGTVSGVAISSGVSTLQNIVLGAGASEPGGAVSIATFTAYAGASIGGAGTSPVLKLGLVSMEGAASLGSLLFDSSGTASASAFTLAVYRDDGNGVFDNDPAAVNPTYNDMWLGSGNFGGVSSQAVISFGSNQTLNDGSTQYFFVTMTASGPAVGSTFGIVMPSTASVGLLQGTMTAQGIYPVATPLRTVLSTIDVWSTLYTGLDVRSGQTINISASGLWRVNGVNVDATGSGTGMYNGVVYNAPVGALIARVGDSSPWFYVGASTSLVYSGLTGQLQLHMNANYDFGTGAWNYPYGVSGQLYVDYSVVGDTHAVLSGTVTYGGAAGGGSSIIVNARAHIGEVETIVGAHTIPLPLTGGSSFYTMRGIEIPYGGDSTYVTLRAYVDTDPAQFGTGPGDINVRIGQPAAGGNVTVYPGAGVVIGTVTYPSGAQQFGDTVVALFSSLGGEPVASTTIPSGVSTFSIAGVPGPAFYRVFAFRDVNYDGKPNGPEPFGYYGTAGALSAMDVNASTVSVAIGEVSTVPVVIALQDMGQINGRVDLGALSSPVRVVVQAGHGMPGTSFQVENWMDYQATPCWWTYCVNEVWYDVGTLTPGSDYTVVAFLDKNGNGQWDCASSETCERFSSSRNNISVTANAIAQADIVMSSNSVPDSPQSFSGTVVSTAQILWTWSDVATETSYYLTDSGGNVLHTLGANTTYYFENVPGGANSLSPVRAVRAHNAAGDSALSTGLALYTKAAPPVLSISGFTASSVSIGISSATNRLWLVRSTSAVGGYAIIYGSTTASPVTSRTDIGLNPGTAYYYKAVNFNAQNLASEFSASTHTVTSAASGYYISGTVNYPGLMSGNITVQRSTSSSMADAVSLALAGNTTQPYYLSGLTSNTSYYLRAFVDYNGDGARHTAEDSSVIVGPVYVGASGVGGRDINIVRSTAAPASPSGLAATPGFQRVTLLWNASASPNLLGYEVFRSTAASFLPFTAASGSSLVSGVSFTDLSPLVNTPVYYRVRAVDWGRNRSLPAALSSPVTVTAGGSIVGTVYAVDIATAGLYHVRVSTTPDAGVPSIADMLVPTSPSTYTITGLPDGTYYLRGYRDVNSDFKQDRSREPSGTHGGVARPFDLFVTQGNTLTGVNVKVCSRIPLAVGVSSTVALSSTTCEALDRGPGYYTRIFTFEAGYGAGKVPPGSQVTVSANGAGIGDPFLYLVGPSGDVVASDDDSGGNMNSRIQYTVPAAGVYLIEPTSYSPGMTGGVEVRYEVTGGFAGQIAGTLSYSGSMTGTSVVQIYSSLDEGAWPIRTSTAAASFEIYGLQDGYFYLKAFKDVNNNGVQDSFEPYGVYGGTSAVQFQVSGGVTSASLAITLAEPAVGSVSGYLTYSEGRSGNIRIEAARPSGSSSELSVVGFSTIARSGAENVSQAYALGLLAPATNYTIRAFVDENGNNYKDVMEPFASVASSVTASTDTAGVNLNIRNPGTGAVGNSSLSGYISYTPIPGQGYVSTGSVWVGWAGDENFDNIFYAQTISTFTWDAVSSTWAYSRSGVLGGTSYYMAAFLDLNSNGQPDEDSGEPVGFYSVGGQMAPLYVPASSAVVRDIFMVSPSTGYISGVVHYYGAMTGSAMVQAWNRACDNEGGNKNCSSRSYFNVVSTSVTDYPFTLRFLDPTTSYQMSAVMDLNANQMTDPGEPSAFLQSYVVTGTTAAVLTMMDPGQMAGGNMGEISGVVTYGGHQGGNKIVRLFRGGFGGAPIQTLDVTAQCLGNSCNYTLSGLPLESDYYVDAFVDTSFNAQYEPAAEPYGRIAFPIPLSLAMPVSRTNYFTLDDPGTVILSTGSNSLSGNITVRGSATGGTIRTRLYAYSGSRDAMQVPVRVATYTYSAGASYSFPDLPAGSYLVQAYADHDGDFVADSTEAWGQTRTADNGIGMASPEAQKSFSICVRTPITAGQTLNGSLETSDCFSSERSAYEDRYSFQGRAGDIVTAEMLASGFSDTYLYLYGPVVTGTNTYTGGSSQAPNAYNLLAADDDGAGNLNSRISGVILPVDGVYTIGAASYGSNITGAYTMSLRVSGGSNGSIAGTVRYNGTQGGSVNVGLFNSDPRNSQGAQPVAGASMNVPGDFAFGDLPTGTTYYIAGFVDVNANNSPDSGEDFGLYPNPITLRTGQNVSGLLLEINASTEAAFAGGAAQGTISGAISYAGASTATALVIEMWNTSTFQGMPVGIRTAQVSGEWPLPYDLQVPGDQTYYLKAFLDSNGNRMPDLNEAKGAFEPNNEGPEPIYVGSAAYVSDRGFTLYDPGQSLAGGAGGAAGEGWASVLPASVPAGSQFTATVTVRVNGLGDGGTVLVGLPGNLWSSLRTDCQSCPGYATVSLDGTAYDTTGLTIPPPPPGSFMPSNTARYQAPAGGLAPGTSVYFAIRNLYAPCQGGMTGAMGQTDNALRFHVGTSSSAATAPQPLVNGEPVATLSAGAPQNMSFRLADNSNNYNMAVPNGEATAMVAEARDNCWNPAVMNSVYVATVSAYVYDMASAGYVLDNTVKFSSWAADGNDIPNTSTAAAVRFEAGSSTGTFYIKPTVRGYRNVGLSYDLGWPNTFYMGVQVMAGGGITAANVSTGVYNNFSASSMTLTITPNGDGNSDRAYINFAMADPNMGWHVAVSSIPYGRGVTPTPVWETWGWGQPSPGQIFWEGRYSPWMNYGGVLPTGAYFVRIEAGSLRNDTLRVNVVVPQVSGQVTDAGTTPPRPLSGVSVNAYGMSGWGQSTTDAGGNYAIPGLAQGQYNFQFSKEEYGMVSSQTAIGANGGSLSVSMRRAPALILIPSLENGTTQQYDQWGWINVHTENWDRVYNGSLRIPASTSAASIAYIDDGGRWDAATGQFVTRRRIRFDVEPSTYSIEAELPGYGRVHVSSYVGSAGLELALPAFTRKANISGLVSLPSSNPNGTWVSVNAMPIVPSTSVTGGWGGVWMNQGVTVSTYNIYGLDPGTYTIRAQVPGYSGVSSGPVIVGAADITGLDMPQFGEGKVIRGTVTVAGDTGNFTMPSWMHNWTQPIRVNINVWSPQTYTNGWTEIFVATSATQAQSTFTITGLDAGTTYQLFANIDYNREGGGAEFTVPGGFPKQVYVGAGGGDSEFSFALASGAIAGTIRLPLDPAPDFSRVGMGVRITRSDNPYNLGEHFYMPDISAPCGGEDKCLPGFSSNTATGEATFRVTGMETQTIEVTFNYGLTGISRTAMVNVVSGSTSTVVVDLTDNTYAIYGSVTNQISNPSFNTMAAAIANSSFTFPSGHPYMLAPNATSYLPIEAVRRDLSEFGVAISTTFDPAKTRVGYVTQAGTYTITGLQDGVYVVRTLPLRLCATCEMLVAPQEKVVTIRGADYTNNRRVLVDGVYVGTGSVNFTLIDGWNLSGTIAIENSVQDARMLRLTLRNRRNEVVRSTSVALGNAATNSLSNSAAYSFTRLPGGEFYTLEVRDTRDSNGLTKYVAAPLRFPDIGTSPNGMQSDLTGQNVTLKQGAMVTLKLRDLNSATLLTQSNYSLLAPNFACFATANPWVQGGYYVAASSISGRPIEADGTVRIGPVMPGVYYDVRCEQSSWDVGYMRTGAQNYSPAVVAGVRPSAGETRDLGVLDLKQGQALTGDVRDRSGQPLGNIKVVAKPSYIESSILVQAMTNREGRYSLWVSTHVSRYFDITAAPWEQSQSADMSTVVYRESVYRAVDLTRSTTADFTLDAVPGGVSGMVGTVDSGALSYPFGEMQGFPAAALFIQPYGTVPKNNPIGDIEAVTDPGGAFSVPLTTGSYTMRVVSLGYSVPSVTFTVTGSGMVNVGTMTLVKGGTVTGQIRKPDSTAQGGYTEPNSDEITLVSAANDGFTEFVMGTVVTDPVSRTINRYTISGFKPDVDYSLALMSSDGDLNFPSEGTVRFGQEESTGTKTVNLTFRPSHGDCMVVAKQASGGKQLKFVCSKALRNRTFDDGNLTLILTTSAVNSSGEAISAPDGTGFLSDRELSADRKKLTVMYSTAASEGTFSVRLTAYTSEIDPATGDNFLIDRVYDFYTGVQGVAAGKVNNMNGGRVELEGDDEEDERGSVEFQPGTFALDGSTYALVGTTVTVELSKADSRESHGSGVSALSSGGGSGGLASIRRTVPEGIYQAMQALREGRVGNYRTKAGANADVNPFSSFYDIALPAGISHALRQPARITLSYDTAISSGVVSDLNVYYYNPDSRRYVLENDGRAVDTDNGTISVNVDHLSVFVVLAQAPVAGATAYAYTGAELKAHNFPNPFNNTRWKSISLNDAIAAGGYSASATPCVTQGTCVRVFIPAGTSGEMYLKIFNIAGELVREMELTGYSAGTTTVWPWDGRNGSGEPVASGIYIGEVKVGSDKTFFKMAVVKSSKYQ